MFFLNDMQYINPCFAYLITYTVKERQAKTQSCRLMIGNSFPDPFFHSRIPGNVDIHSRDSRAPRNNVYCSTDRLFPGHAKHCRHAGDLLIARGDGDSRRRAVPHTLLLVVQSVSN